jgi:hypothetical protein
MLENPGQVPRPRRLPCNGLSFDDATMREPLALVDRRGVFQVKSTKAYGDCTVVAKADTIVGAHIGEWKTTTSTFDVEKYLQSCQWRFELDIFGAPQLTYHVFCSTTTATASSSSGHPFVQRVRVSRPAPGLLQPAAPLRDVCAGQRPRRAPARAPARGRGRVRSRPMMKSTLYVKPAGATICASAAASSSPTARSPATRTK